MSNRPLVSIILATYNRRDDLRRALLSLSRQAYPNFEVIVVDDNADAQTQEIVQTIADEFRESARIRLLQDGLRKGSARSRNMGIAAAQGEYITFLDDDDEYLPDKVQSQVQSMLDKRADFGITDLVLYSEKDRLLEYRKRNYLLGKESLSLLACHLKYHMTGTDTLMFKADYLREIGGFPPIDLGDEFYLMLEAIRMGGTLAYLPQCDVKAYVHMRKDGLSSGQKKIDGENKLFAYKKQFFSEISPADRRYICMRHYAVLMFAELRRKRIPSAFCYGICSFLLAPINFFRLAAELFTNMRSAGMATKRAGPAQIRL